ncbi:MAG: dihydrofolate reductase family protein [Actinobacteria bacterium]|nr:dihydrofolate reductase family protein [Actinomycetota bacterium]
MRKLVVTEFVSLDGVMEAPGGDDGYVHGAWTMPFWCDEVGAYKSAELFAADALLLGRRTYQGFAAAWPERGGDPFSDAMNSMPKHVVSRTLTSAEWTNSHILGGDMEAAVRALKEADGADILVAGSSTLVHGLLRADLVDELRLAIYPVALGVGMRVFPDDARVDFELAEMSQTSTGVLLTSYRRVDRRPVVTFDYDTVSS